MFGIRFLTGLRLDYFLRHHIQICSELHPASFENFIGGCILWSKHQRTWSWPLTSI